ncbi:hypothetical protein ACQPYK_24725 [Streptosporangium sp. CA-135522]|uniref:hypothetical protein n=1 Tax=Streptosporangium sp. CA-135522 TaxID=3240072 RepID=UPI003D928B64
MVAVLDPDVVLRADTGAMPAGGLKVVRGAAAVAGQALTFQRFATSHSSRSALVNGAAGVVSTADDRIMSVLSFTITNGRITTIDILADPDPDPDRLRRLDLAVLDD